MSKGRSWADNLVESFSELTQVLWALSPIHVKLFRIRKKSYNSQTECDQ